VRRQTPFSILNTKKCPLGIKNEKKMKVTIAYFVKKQ
jgi:hypothetical protein